MKLYIDSRETSKLTEQVEAQALGYNIPIEKTWLEIGDYILEDVCFEAKSSFDFLQSAVNKRLWSQIDNMDRAFTHNTVIVYGSISSAIKEYQKYIKSTDKFPTRLLENKFLGAIGKIILDTDCNIVLTSDSKTAAKIICAVFKMKPINRDVYSPRLIKQKKISTTDLRVDVLMTIKGISEVKSQILIDEFGSIMEIGESSISELCKLDGIGSTLAKRLLDTLNSEEKQAI